MFFPVSPLKHRRRITVQWKPGHEIKWFDCCQGLTAGFSRQGFPEQSENLDYVTINATESTVACNLTERGLGKSPLSVRTLERNTISVHSRENMPAQQLRQNFVVMTFEASFLPSTLLRYVLLTSTQIFLLLSGQLSGKQALCVA